MILVLIGVLRGGPSLARARRRRQHRTAHCVKTKSGLGSGSRRKLSISLQAPALRVDAVMLSLLTCFYCATTRPPLPTVSRQSLRVFGRGGNPSPASGRFTARQYRLLSKTDQEIEDESLRWIKNVVIGYNMCPFAEKPRKEGNLSVVVVRGDDDELVAGTVAYHLVGQSTRKGTTVVVAPEYCPDDFEEYLNLLSYLEDDMMDELDLHGIMQIAPFHPLFQFDGSGEGADNFTNRSPYPCFHLLREDEVSAAVDKLGGDSSKVYARNVELLEQMEKRFGLDGIRSAWKGEPLQGMSELLKEFKRETT